MNTILRTFVIVFACGAFFTPLLSKPITRKKANDVAKAFFASKDVEGNAILAYPIASTRGSESSSAPYYIFNSSDNKGFVIVAGDDDSESILGYSSSGSFDYDNAPEGLKDLLEAYTKHLPTSQNTGTRATEWKAVAPMLTTKWGQNYPYNQSCPVFFNGKRCLTGCVATAMAQVLYYNYKRYPDKVIKELPRDIPSYECETNWDGYGHLSVDGIPEGTTIDWQNMTDKLDESTSKIASKAVADLMFYCAASIRSDFGDYASNGTGAKTLSSNARDADGIPLFVGADFCLKRYFNIDDTSDKSESTNAPSNWNNLIYNEMINSRPVIYSGKDSNKNGHSFVIDGCNTNKMFHINWGWEGYCNGFYNLDAFTTKEGSFSQLPDIIYNIKPKVSSTINTLHDNYNKQINIYLINGIKKSYMKPLYAKTLHGLSTGIIIIDGKKYLLNRN